MSFRLKPGFVGASPTCARTHIYSLNAEQMCHLRELKHAEAAKKWRTRSCNIPPLLSVEHGCQYESE
jgi:hypothetical protein